MEKVNVFFDLDGVLFEYNRDDYLGDNPKYLQKKYYRNRPVDTKAAKLFIACLNDPTKEVYILSRTPTINDELSIANDKIANVLCTFPQINHRHIILNNLPKEQVIMQKFHRPLNKNDVLIDDYNKNLIAWENAGGIGIKYINEWNSKETWDLCFV